MRIKLGMDECIIERYIRRAKEECANDSELRNFFIEMLKDCESINRMTDIAPDLYIDAELARKETAMFMERIKEELRKIEGENKC